MYYVYIYTYIHTYIHTYNCATYNTYNKDKKTNENHSSLDRNCPNLQAMIVKYRQNTNY